MNRYRWPYFLITLLLLWAPVTAWATFTIQTQTAVEITLTGFDGLEDLALFEGEIAKGHLRGIDTPYRGLALLSFVGGQSYPVIIGDGPFVLKITDPGKPPSFTDSGENDFLYRSLSGVEAVSNGKYPFADVLLRAKNLLESTYTINTMTQLAAKKKELAGFVASNYRNLRHSDMVRRLMAQSFMMHEYVDYLVEEEPTTAIQARYGQEVLSGVGDWLKALSPHHPGHEVVNTCVSFYYERGMVSMASQIIDRFPAEAICPGEPAVTFHLPEDLTVTDARGKPQGTLADLKGEKTVALVADDCPVSMTVAVVKARALARQKSANPLIVAPLQRLSKKHLAMAKMIRDEKILFIDDEKWFRGKPANWPRLPFFFE